MDIDRVFDTCVTRQAFFIGGFVVTVVVPLAMVERLIAERGQRHDNASAEVGSTWGHGQTIGGPILVVPLRLTSEGQSVANDELYLLPDQLDIASDVQSQALARGIYRIPVYNARVHISGRFALPAGSPGTHAV